MEKKNDLTVEISKDFSVPVDKLYKAWISPDALKQWWSPMGKKLTEVKNEVRKGGTIEYKANKNGSPLVIKGEYEEVIEKEKLVYTWDFNFLDESYKDSSYRLTVKFKEQDNGSNLEVKQESLKDHEAVRVHKEGWEKELESLKEYLNQ